MKSPFRPFIMVGEMKSFHYPFLGYICTHYQTDGGKGVEKEINSRHCIWGAIL